MMLAVGYTSRDPPSLVTILLVYSFLVYRVGVGVQAESKTVNMRHTETLYSRITTTTTSRISRVANASFGCRRFSAKINHHWSHLFLEVETQNRQLNVCIFRFRLLTPPAWNFDHTRRALVMDVRRSCSTSSKP